jgi:serine/threonine-protein kinase RsbT
MLPLMSRSSYVFGREEDRFWCAREAARCAEHAGLPPIAAREVSIAVAELVGNAVRHAGGGVLTIRPIAHPAVGLEVTVTDEGPGLVRAEDVFTDGFSEGRVLDAGAPRRPGQGLGLGLGAVRRLMDEVEVRAGGRGGVVIVARRWSARR